MRYFISFDKLFRLHAKRNSWNGINTMRPVQSLREKYFSFDPTQITTQLEGAAMEATSDSVNSATVNMNRAALTKYGWSKAMANFRLISAFDISHKF